MSQAVLSLDEVLVHPRAHGAGTVERHGGDDVLELVGLQPAEEALHPVGLELKDALGLAGGQQLEGGRVVHGKEREIEGLSFAHEVGTRADEAHGDLQDGQRLEAEEIELDEAGRLDVAHVVLRDQRAGLLVAEDRHVIPQRPLADDDARRVLAGVPRQSLQLARLVE